MINFIISAWTTALSGYPGIFLTPSELRERFGSIAQVKTSISGRELEIYLIQSSLEPKNGTQTYQKKMRIEY